MFCGKCGSMVPDGQAFCNICGAPLGNQQAQPQQPNYQQPPVQPNYQQPPVQPNYQQPNYQQPPVQPPYQPVYNQTPLNATMPMGWFKFLIYFALWAGAVFNLITGIMAVSGNMYGEDTKYVYAAISDLEGLDIFIGLACIALAVFGVITRFALAGYKANGPKLLAGLYSALAAIELFYAISAVAIIEDSYIGAFIDTSEITAQAWSSAIIGVVMVAINTVYFNKRKEMFKN